MANKRDQQRRENAEAAQRQRREARLRAQERAAKADEAKRSAMDRPRKPIEVWRALLRGEAVINPYRIPTPTLRDHDRTQKLLRLLARAERKAGKIVEPARFPVLWELADMPWVRPVEQWRPAGRSPRRKLHSLAEHLLALYPLPAFLYSVLEETRPASLRVGLRLFASLGQGTSPRKLMQQGILPANLTRRMCRLWLEQKAHLDWLQALRHAQVQALDGDRRLAEAFCETPMGRGWQADEAFWQRVIQWFANQAMLDPRQVGPLCDYIRHALEQDPSWSISGRTPASLERATAEWHGELQKLRRVQGQSFAPSGLAGFSLDIKRRRAVDRWTVEELLFSRALVAEGQALKHCVYSYAGGVAAGRCSIWSMRLNGERRLTIEVHNGTGRIVQARGSCNRSPEPTEADIMARWATMAGLTVATGRW